MLKNIILGYIAKRAQEKSTWLGLIALVATHFGLHLAPDVQGQLVQTLMDLAALVFIVMKDGNSAWVKDAPQLVQPVHPAGSMTTKELNEESRDL